MYLNILMQYFSILDIAYENMSVQFKKKFILRKLTSVWKGSRDGKTTAACTTKVVNGALL